MSTYSPDPPVVAVLGASGAVGRRLTALLHRGGARLRLGGRTAGRDGADDENGTELIDADPGNAASLEAFADGAAVLVNCVGSGFRARSRIATAALAQAVPYVDPSGDAGLAARITGAAGASGFPVPLLLGAGAVPGASGLLARWLVAGRAGQARTLTGYVLTIEPLHAATATEFLLALSSQQADGTGQAGQAGQTARLPYVSGPLDAFPNRSREAGAVAADTGLETRFFQAFESDSAILRFLTSVGRRRGEGATVRQLAGDLTAVVTSELAGRPPLHLIAWEAGSAGRCASVVLRSGSSYQLTASMLALAVREVLAGRVPPGVRYADVLAPELITELPGLDHDTHVDTRPEPLSAWAAST
jgi:hypothetical protein